MSLAQARRHYHLDLNDKLDELQELPINTENARKHLRQRVNQIWTDSRDHEGTGEWEKILSRIYRFAGLSRSKRLRTIALRHILKNPKLSQRILDYVRVTGTVDEYLDFVESLWEHDEQVYQDVNLTTVETLLRLEPTGKEASRIRAYATTILRGQWKFKGAMMCATVAPLLLFRFGDKRSLPLLHTTLAKREDEWTPIAVRAAAIVYASYGMAEFRAVRKVAASSFSNPLASMVQMIERIRKYKKVPGSYAQRITLGGDSVSGSKFVDMRTLLAARLLRLNSCSGIVQWLDSKKET